VPNLHRGKSPQNRDAIGLTFIRIQPNPYTFCGISANQQHMTPAGLLLVYTPRVYYLLEARILSMSKARIFKSGNSQAVRLPKEFRFDVDEVEIQRRGDEIVLRKVKRNLLYAFAALAAMPEDFMAGGRKDEPPQKRTAP
jgi:antitoxin VapB